MGVLSGAVVAADVLAIGSFVSATIIFSLQVPTEGKESGMIPSATQASLLRNSLSELSVT